MPPIGLLPCQWRKLAEVLRVTSQTAANFAWISGSYLYVSGKDWPRGYAVRCYFVNYRKWREHAGHN